MADRSLQASCRDCGRPASAHAAGDAVRCEPCFDDFLRARDIEFLSSYAALGVTRRRVVAETCLRALVMTTPPQRKVLAMTIMEQYVAAASDLIGLYHAIKRRAIAPVMRTFSEFTLDRATSVAFFQEIARTPAPELLDTLGLPQPSDIARRLPSLSKADARDLARALDQLLYDLNYVAQPGETAALALAQMAGEAERSVVLKDTAWLDDIGLRNDQVASMALDPRRRTVNIAAVTVDEKKLERVISAINAMTRAAENMLYGVLSIEQQRAVDRGRATPRGRRRAAS
jgi:hypothetical protein